MTADTRLDVRQLLVWLGPLGAVSLAWLAYQGAVGNGFLHWDDYPYVYRNPHIKELDWAMLRWAFTQTYAGNWHPLAWLSHALDYRLAGLAPWAHHLSSVVLHAANSVLVWVLTLQLLTLAAPRDRRRALGPAPLDSAPLVGAAFAAALFAVHPQHVESVAWIAERKDVLCAFFVLLTFISYLAYGRDPTQSKRLTGSFLFFTLALLAKPMAVSVPLVLLLLDVYPLHRVRGESPGDLRRRAVALLAEKWAFFALSALVAAITVIAQSHAGTIRSLGDLGPLARALSAAHGLLFYLQTFLLPVGLSPFYPFPPWITSPSAVSVIAPLVVLTAFLLCLREWGRGQRYWLAVALYYVIALSPVLGVVQVGQQATADRYAYLPTIGFYVLVGAGLSRALSAVAASTLLRISALLGTFAILLVLVMATRQQTAVWKSDESLWLAVLERYPNSSVALTNLGNVYLGRGDLQRAIASYRKAVAANPSDTLAQENLGVALIRSGAPDQGAIVYERLLRAVPTSSPARVRLGDLYVKLGRFEEAGRQYDSALAVDPGNANAYFGKGVVAEKEHRWADAEALYRRALAVDPDHRDATLWLAVLHQRAGRLCAAATEYRRTLRLDPGNRVAQANLASVLASPSVNAKQAACQRNAAPHD